MKQDKAATIIPGSLSRVVCHQGTDQASHGLCTISVTTLGNIQKKTENFAKSQDASPALIIYVQH